MDIILRKARPGDLARINEIYNHYVLESTCTFQIEPETLAARGRWFRERSEKHPVVVAVQEASILGWGAVSRFKERAAYAGTGEISVYVDFHFLHQGLGERLLLHLIEQAEASGLHALISIIAADQIPSLRLHEKLGFFKAAHLKEVGFKFNQWLDVIYMQRLLG